jgi:hypothetical protein
MRVCSTHGLSSPALRTAFAAGIAPPPDRLAAVDIPATTAVDADGSAPRAFPSRPFETNTKTKFCCPSCDGAFLCQVKRVFVLPSGELQRSEKSCHILWHTRRVLNPLPLSAQQKVPEGDASSVDNTSPPTIMPNEEPAANEIPPPLPSAAATAPVATQEADGVNVLLELASSGRATAPSRARNVESAVGPRRRSYEGGNTVAQDPQRSKRPRKPNTRRD